MRLLYIGGDTVPSIAAAVSKKYPAFNVTPITKLSDLQYVVSRGEVIDRAIVFDSFCAPSFSPEFSRMTVRKQIQVTLDVIKEHQEACLECVCIAQTPITTQCFIEELYEYTYNTAVFSVTTSLPLSTILNFTVKSIAELRKTSCKTPLKEIYQSNDDVIWSTKKIVTSTWTQLNSETLTVKLKDKFRLNIALDLLDFWVPSATWEYKEDIEALQAKKDAPPEPPKLTDENNKPLSRKEQKALQKQHKLEMKRFKAEEKKRKKLEKRSA